MEHRELKSYLRDETGKPWGVLVSNKANSVGWAVCNPKDQFDKKIGTKKARFREAANGQATLGVLPEKLRKEVAEAVEFMLDRSRRYFRDPA